MHVVVSDLELYLVELECSGLEQPVRSMLMRLAADSGEEGWGESPSGWRPAEMDARRDALLAAIAGRSVFDVEELLGLEALASAPLRCAVEMASWDLMGRAISQPGAGDRQCATAAPRTATPASIPYAQAMGHG